MSSRRSARRLASAVAVASLAFAATPALAITTHVFTTDFGAAGSTPANPYPLSNPTGVAVDNSSGASQHNIYVTDPANHRVEKFDSAGNFLLMFGKDVDQTTGGNVCPEDPGDTCQAGSSGSSPDEFETPTFVAVDGSSGPSAGDVYVGDTGDNRVSKFTSSAELVASWGTGGQLSGLGEIGGIAVDPVGNLFVLNWQGDESDGEMLQFAQDGSSTTHFGMGPRGASPNGIAVDAEDNLYKVAGRPNVEKFNSTGTDLGQVDEQSDATGLVGDPSTNDLYVDQAGTLIEHFTAGCHLNSCTPSDTFGTGHLSGAEGVAYDATSGNVYVANTGAGTVAVFAAAVIPSFIVAPVSGLTRTSVTLNAVVEPAGGEKVTACQFEYGTNINYTLGSIPCSPSPPYSIPTEVSADISGLQAGTTYNYRIVATDAGGSNVGNDETFTTAPAVAGLGTGPATNLTPVSAMLTGSYTGEGLDTHYFFEYGTTEAYGETTAIEDSGEGTGPQAVPPIAISGLAPETTYHYRIVASNTFGSTPGQDETLTTAPAVAGLGTGPAANLAPASATLTGSYTGEGLDTHYFFEYGTTEAYGETTAIEDAGEGTGPQAVAPIAISGLSPETTYHYRIVARNTFGSTPGQDETLTTAPAVAGLGTGPAANLAPASATLTGSYTGEGLDTHYFFEYGTTEAYGETTAIEDAGEGTGPQAVAPIAISGLTPETTYHYRIVASNTFGSTPGQDETLTTAPPYLPAIESTTSSPGAAGTTATLEAQINPGFGATVSRFQYGTSASYESSTPISESIGSDDSDHLASANISGLTPGTTYHYRAVAINFTGTTHGPDRTFTTPGMPLVNGTSVSNVTETTATLAAQINPELAATTYHFQYGASASYGSSTPQSASIGSDNSVHAASAAIGGLQPGTTYHYRVIATNAIAASDGPDQTFSTVPAVVTPPAEPPVTCKKGLVKKHGKCVKKKRHHHKRRHHG